MSRWGAPSGYVSMLCHINIQASRISRLPCSPAGSEVMEMLMSLQEALPAAEEGGTDLSSLLLVLLHQRHFSTDWWKAKRRRQTAVFIASQPQFRRTAVIRPLPQRFTSPNSSDHSGPAFFSKFCQRHPAFFNCSHIYSYCLSGDSFCLFAFRWTIIFVAARSRSAWQLKGFEGGHNRCPECWEVHVVQSAAWQKGLCVNCLACKPAHCSVSVLLRGRWRSLCKANDYFFFRCLLCPRRYTLRGHVPWASWQRMIRR